MFCKVKLFFFQILNYFKPAEKYEDISMPNKMNYCTKKMRRKGGTTNAQGIIFMEKLFDFNVYLSGMFLVFY